MTPISHTNGSYSPPSFSSGSSLKATASTHSKTSSCAKKTFLKQKDSDVFSSTTIRQERRGNKKVSIGFNGTVSSKRRSSLPTSTSRKPSLSIVGAVSVPKPATRSNVRLRKNLLNSIEKNDLEAVRAFLLNGADVNDCVAFGITPLMNAADIKKHNGEEMAQYGEEMVQFLLLNGAAVDQVDEGGRTALLWGVHRSEYVVKILLDAGASINHVDIAGRVALMAAAESGSHFSINVLLQRGAEIDKRDLSGNTTLMIAASQDCEDTTKSVQLLLEAGADASSANDLGETALTLSKAIRDLDSEDSRYSTNFNSIQTAIISDKLRNEESLSDSEKEFFDSQYYNKKLAENRIKAFTRKRTLVQTHSQASGQASALSESSKETQENVKKIKLD